MRFTFSTARISVLAFLAVAVGVLFTLPGRAQFDAITYDSVKPSVVRVFCPDRSATGFVWPDRGRVVTAMHVIEGCADLQVHYEAQGASRKAKVVRVLKSADLALLQVANPVTASPLGVDDGTQALTEALSTLGYPLQTTRMRSSPVELAYGASTLGEILPQSVAQQIADHHSPSLQLEIDNINGHLLPGHSGAPIFNRNRKVVAVADGGLENGAAAVSWAIPAKYLAHLGASNDPVPTTAGTRTGVLFAAEMQAQDLGETACSGTALTKLRSVSFLKASASADDQRGLMQLVQFFQVNPAGFVFDVYQHLPSGATFVVPQSANLADAGDGTCVAVLPSGKVTVHLELALTNSVADAQLRRSQFELSMAGKTPRAWIPDPQWTYSMPMPRFDGMVVRRCAYEHMSAFMFQDRYLFETLALRKNAFIGAAAMYTITRQLTQKMNACRFSGFSNPGCEDVRQMWQDWVQSVLAIQLTTFPIG